FCIRPGLAGRLADIERIVAGIPSSFRAGDRKSLRRDLPMPDRRNSLAGSTNFAEKPKSGLKKTP
ncbi:MAG: hypothetical protein AB7F32_09285, partial [Victivallaceae bacterium]